MSTVDVGTSAGYFLVARRNNSLTRSERQRVFCFICAVSFCIAVAFSAFGAWLVLPFAGLEMAVLYAAFRYIDRHAGDYERLEISGDVVRVETREGSQVRRQEMQRYWAQVVVSRDEAGHHCRVALRSHGRELEFGRHLTDDERMEVAREIRRHLRKGS